MFARFATATTALSLMLFAMPARADTPAAEALFESGRTLLEKGAYDEACAKLAESRRLDPQVGVTLFLAECYERAGKTASAWVTFRAAAEDADRAKDARASIAERRAARLEPRLSRLVVSVRPAVAVAGLVVTRDGEEVRSAQWGVAVPIDPGAHVIVVEAPDKKSWRRELTIAARNETTTIEIPTLAEDARTAPPPPSRPVRETTSTTRTIGLIALGAGAIAAGAGTVFGIMTLDTASDLERRCPTHPNCDESDREALTALDSDARRTGTISTISFVAAGVLVAAGAVLFFTSPKRVRPTTVDSAFVW